MNWSGRSNNLTRIQRNANPAVFNVIVLSSIMIMTKVVSKLAANNSGDFVRPPPPTSPTTKCQDQLHQHQQPVARVWIRTTTTTTNNNNNNNAAAEEEEEHCIFGKSVFDALGSTAVLLSAAAGAAKNNDDTSTTMEALHYDRRMVHLFEDITVGSPGTSSASTVSTNTTCTSSSTSTNNKNKSTTTGEGYRVVLSPFDLSLKNDMITAHPRKWSPPIPLGRSRWYPPLNSTACPASKTTTTAAAAATTVSQNNYNKNNNKPYTGLAAVGIVLDPTKTYVLLTRRPAFMRSFPGAWVLLEYQVVDLMLRSINHYTIH